MSKFSPWIVSNHVRLYFFRHSEQSTYQVQHNNLSKHTILGWLRLLLVGGDTILFTKNKNVFAVAISLLFLLFNIQLFLLKNNLFSSGDACAVPAVQRHPLAVLLKRICFPVAMPVLFLLFNVIYWLFYSKEIVFYSGDACAVPAVQRHLLAVLRQPSYAHYGGSHTHLATHSKQPQQARTLLETTRQCIEVLRASSKENYARAHRRTLNIMV